MRATPLFNLKQGINRLRVKGGANPSQLYDLLNAYITADGSIVPREGTIRAATLNGSTVGLCAVDGVFNVFATSLQSVPVGYQCNVLVNPSNPADTLVRIWFAQPFMGFLFVVAEFASGDVLHYWLQNNGNWAADTVYMTGNIVLPDTPNGLAYQAVRDMPANPLWTPETSIALNDIVEPNEYTGYCYKAIATSADSDVGLLLHMDGSSGSTAFTDSSQFGLVNTPFGSGTQVSASTKKFGTGSASFNGSGGMSFPMTAGGPIDVSQGDWTIEFWINPTTESTNGIVVFALGNAASTLLEVEYNTGLNNVVTVYNTGASGSSATNSIPFNVWTAVAIVMHNDIVTIYINGTASGTPATRTRPAAFTTALTLGLFSGDANPFVGFIDEFRLTLSALYTSNYTPATVAFQNPPAASSVHTGSTEPVWPTTSAATIQEFGDFDVSSSDSGTFNTSSASGPIALGANITDRYGNSSDIAGLGTVSSASIALPTASTRVTTWQPGTLYAPGAVVQPSTNQGAFVDAIPNGDFENGDDGNWTLTGTPGDVNSVDFLDASGLQYQGEWCLVFRVANTQQSATMFNFGACTPGQSVTATCYLNPDNSGANLSMFLALNWYDASDTFISTTNGPIQQGAGYRKASVTGLAPAGTAGVRLSIVAGNGTGTEHDGYADLATWNLEVAAPVSNFLYEAVQAIAGASASTEPTWPTVEGDTVVDGGVTWEAVGTSIITWEAIPIMLSGADEPTFTTTVGTNVGDPSSFTDANGITNKPNPSMSWECISRQITDANDPNTTIVCLGASHVFAGDDDIVPYSAAVNPTDWTSANNAGYLPTGLNNYGANPVAVLALYRSNLMAFNAGGYQMWQIDPDPANMALLDAQPVGSIYTRAAQSVANDLLFLTEVGIRNLGTVGATANMQIGQSGQPVDPIVKKLLASGTYGVAQIIGLYYPGRGQYWLFFGPMALVFTINGQGLRTWSRYVFPDTITDWTLSGGLLYLRTAGNLVWQLDASTLVDDAPEITSASGSSIVFDGWIQWPYVDAQAVGIHKQLVGIDLVGTGEVNVQIAYNEGDPTSFSDNAAFSSSTGVTAPYLVNMADTLYGTPIPIPCAAPSFSLILNFPGDQAWSWQAANLYIADFTGSGEFG